jgi:hypothetical protein
MVSKATKKSYMAKLKKIVLKIRLSIRVRNFASLNKPQIIFFDKFYFKPQNHPQINLKMSKKVNL